MKYLSARYARILRTSISGVLLLARYSRKSLRANPKVIAIVNNVQIGDMVCATPLFRALREKYPEAKIIVVGGNVNKHVLANNSDVSEYVVHDLKHPENTIRVLRVMHIDAAILPVPSLDSLLMVAHARIPFVVAPKIIGGWSPSNTKLYQFLTTFVVTKPHYMGSYAPREYLRLLEPFDIHTEDTTKRLGFSPAAAKAVEALLTKENITGEFVCITPGAGNKIKQWPPERFARIAEYIWRTYSLPIIVIGTDSDRAEITEMVAAVSPEVHLINTMNLLPLDELKALLARAKLVIGVDTGPIYIAEAFNTMLIDIVGPVGDQEQPPHGPGRVVVLPPYDRVPQLHILNARVYDEQEALRQVMSTTIAQVTVAVDQLLGHH